MRFLADMGVSLSAMRQLREMGHDVTHLEELGLRTLADMAIFQQARIENRIVLTFDLDFASIVATTGSNLPSVIIFRLQRGRAQRVLSRLAAVLASASDALEKGALVIVDDARIRIRMLPLTR